MEQSHPNFSWTYSLKDQQFLFLSNAGFKETDLDKATFPEWFERTSGITRIPPVSGKSFSVISASGRGKEQDLFIRTRGIFLSESPAVVSGICERVKPDDIDYLEETSPDDIQRIVDSWGQTTPKNAVHALRAPANRIRGIAAILDHELELGVEHKQLLEYLKASSERLRKLTWHITRGPYIIETSPASLADVIDNAVKTADDYILHPVQVVIEKHDDRLQPRTALCLYNLAVNILTTSPTPVSIKVQQLDGNVVAVDFTTDKLTHPGDLHCEQHVPDGSLELFRQMDDALVIRRIDESGCLWYRIVLPADALVQVS